MSKAAALKAWATRRAKRKPVPPLKQILALATEQSRWQRKETIARNKLKRIRLKIELLCEELASELTEKDKADNPYAKRKITTT